MGKTRNRFIHSDDGYIFSKVIFTLTLRPVHNISNSYNFSYIHNISNSYNFKIYLMPISVPETSFSILYFDDFGSRFVLGFGD